MSVNVGWADKEDQLDRPYVAHMNVPLPAGGAGWQARQEAY